MKFAIIENIAFVLWSVKTPVNKQYANTNKQCCFLTRSEHMNTYRETSMHKKWKRTITPPSSEKKGGIGRTRCFGALSFKWLSVLWYQNIITFWSFASLFSLMDGRETDSNVCFMCFSFCTDTPIIKEVCIKNLKHLSNYSYGTDFTSKHFDI